MDNTKKYNSLLLRGTVVLYMASARVISLILGTVSYIFTVLTNVVLIALLCHRRIPPLEVESTDASYHLLGKELSSDYHSREYSQEKLSTKTLHLFQ